MPYVKTIVCLAASYKPPGGRCIAGKHVRRDDYGGWIRPVSTRPSAEVSYAEYRYHDGSSPKLLDIIDIPMLHAEPRHHQTENHVIDAGQWVKRGEIQFNDLENLLDHPSSLWLNSDSTSAGCYDCISEAEAGTLSNSLLLIQPEGFVVEVGTSYWTGNRTYRGKFRYNGVHYDLSVTDPVARGEFATKQPGDYPLANVRLCVSLTEPYEHDDRCHKLVAAIITDPPL